jgi:glycosyltransferase involved in cell wall biosynthesis
LIKVINVISDTNIGGAGKILLSFLENYDRNKFDLEVFVPKNSLLIPEIKKLDVKYSEIDGIADRSMNNNAVKLFKEMFEKKKPDIVHTHATLSARIAAREYGKCKIVHTRHSVFDQPAYKKKFPIKQIIGSLNNRLSDVILAVSPAAKENIVETGTNPKKVRVIFNGVAPAKVLEKEERLKIRERYGIKQTDFVCAIIARLEYVKGHEYVIEAAKKLQDRGIKDIKFIIAGTGSIEKELHQKVKSMNLNNVIFTGFIKEIWEIENIMDLQLNASYGTEATSLSLLEGMSLGVPAVVSFFGGNPYVIETGINGMVVKKKDADEIASAVLKLKGDKALYERLSEGALKAFAIRFTSEVMTRNIEMVYEELCPEKAEGR